jgi:hypothetical protein
VDIQRVKSPRGFIASAQRWFVVERKLAATPMARRFILRMQSNGYVGLLRGEVNQ